MTDVIREDFDTVGEINDPPRRPRSRANTPWSRFTAYRLAFPSLIVLVLLVAVCVIGPLVYTIDPNAVDPILYRNPPSSEHLLGTDSAGRDVLARLLHGGRVSLLIGLVAAIAATFIGVLLGALAGFFRGRTDALLSRITDVVQAFPTLIVIITLAAFLGPSFGLLIVSMALMEWTGAYRVVRGLTLSLRERDAIQAVTGLGATNWRVISKHVVPSVLGPATVVATLLTAGVILTEAGLSFLGLGVPPPTASWGSMLSEAQSLQILQTAPWLWLPPGIAITLTVLSVNFVGDGLRNAVDPRQES
ncbi:ABC transporter permease [Microbacterium sp. NPDC087592]|uniref:ABC transporter permease n=1 Tax=Microbacterium sp. NPDC087592 TaxID=3364193 RepID=UPI0038105341